MLPSRSEPEVFHCRRSGVLTVGETPPRSAKPATLPRKLLIAIEARDPVPVSFQRGPQRRKPLGAVRPEAAHFPTGRDLLPPSEAVSLTSRRQQHGQT